MKTKLPNFLFLLTALFLLPVFVSAAPNVDLVSGSVIDGQSVSIDGSSFGTKSTAAPKYFNNLETETLGNIPSNQITNLSKWGTVENNVTRNNKSLEFDHDTTGGSSKADWNRTAIDFGSAQDKIYFSLWLYIDKSLSSYDTTAYNVATYTPGDGVSVPVRITTTLPNNYASLNSVYLSGFSSASGNHPVNADGRAITVIDAYTFDLMGYYNSTPATVNGTVTLSPSWQWKSFTITSDPELYYDLSPSYPSSVWHNNKTYTVSRDVVYNGKTYRCIVAVTNISPVNDPPDVDTTHWQKIADYPYEESQAYSSTTVFANYWWYSRSNVWKNSHANAYFYDYATETNKSGMTIPSLPNDGLLWNQWQRLEFYAQRSSLPGVADGIWREQRVGRSTPTFNASNVITHQEGNKSWRYLVLSNALESAYTGHTNFKIYMDDIYADSSQARVEICDSEIWSARTHCEIQLASSWNDSQIQFDVNKGTFPNGQAYLFVIDESGIASSGYPITFGVQTDFVAPFAPQGLEIL